MNDVEKALSILELNLLNKPQKTEIVPVIFERLFTIMDTFASQNGYGDVFSYGRGREIMQAIYNGHKIANTYSGADGIDKNGDGSEYKSTIQQKILATYNGLSCKPTWEKQVCYLKNDKIGKYKYHYFSRFQDGKIVEMWKASSDDVLNILLPQLSKKYHKPDRSKNADPRLSGRLNEDAIHSISKSVEKHVW